MILTKRERLIISLTVIVVSILVLDRYLFTPLLDRYWAVEARKQRLLGEMKRAEILLSRQRQVGPRWRQMLAGGLRRDPAEAEGQIMHALGDWSEEAGLRLSSLKPERPREKTDLREITFHVTGSGSMNSISRFLWRLETAKVPIKVKIVELRSRKEGTDDLLLQSLRISTLYLAAQSPSPSEASVQSASTGDGQ